MPKYQIRSAMTDFKTREDGDALRIEGYFVVYNSTYQMTEMISESIAPGALSDELSGDVRALIDHDTRLVLGRTTAGTLELRDDEFGLWGSVSINPKDVDAMNLYARVQRGDVNQCSFGFDILSERYEERPDGGMHWTIEKVRLYEVSVVTFPAYTETAVSARAADMAEIKKRKGEAWKLSALAKLKGE